MSTQETVSPWYRQPWFWFLLIFPTAAILWCIVMITVAIKTENAMVTDDYSKEGRAINLELARDQKAIDLGLIAQLDFSDRELRVTLNDQSGSASYPYLVLNLFHPTLEERDRIVQLSPVAEGVYSGTMPSNMDGRWYLDLRGPSNDWRLKGEKSLPSSAVLQLGAVAEGNG